MVILRTKLCFVTFQKLSSTSNCVWNHSLCCMCVLVPPATSWLYSSVRPIWYTTSWLCMTSTSILLQGRERKRDKLWTIVHVLSLRLPSMTAVHPLTLLLGTVSGVPCFTTPSSTTTPTTMGSRVLNMQFGRTRSRQGNTAMCSYSLRFCSRSSCRGQYIKQWVRMGNHVWRPDHIQ